MSCGRVRAVLLLGMACGLVPSVAEAQTAGALEGRRVEEIRIAGLRNVEAADLERHLATEVGAPFHLADLATDRRRLDDLRLFTSVSIEPRLENERLILHVDVTETLRFMPAVIVRVTDENGLSAGVGAKGINLLGHGAQIGVSLRFGGETSVGASVDRTTITPGTWAEHASASYTSRRNVLYDFDEEAVSLEARVGRNWRRGLSAGGIAGLLVIGTGTSGVAVSPDGRDELPSVGAFTTLDTLDSSTNPQSGTRAEVQAERIGGDADSWTFTLDGRQFLRLANRHSVGLFSLATFQTGEVGLTLPEYMQVALGGANSVRGWSLGARRGRNQFLGSAEYAYTLRPVTPFSIGSVNLYAGLQVVGFGDIGVASHDAPDTPSSAIAGYGVGLRLLVPFVDVIRLEVAAGEPGHGATAYFGVSLKAVRQRQRVR